MGGWGGGARRPGAKVYGVFQFVREKVDPFHLGLAGGGVFRASVCRLISNRPEVSPARVGADVAQGGSGAVGPA